MDFPSVNNFGNGSGQSVLGTTGGSFEEDPFLNVLVAQLQTQTPLEPVDNASFVQQISSFSSTQQQQELNQNMLQLLDYQGLLARLQGLSEGSSLLGKDVTFLHEGQEVTGRVDSLFVTESGNVNLRVGDQEVDMRTVIAIGEPGDSDKDTTSGQTESDDGEGEESSENRSDG